MNAREGAARALLAAGLFAAAMLALPAAAQNNEATVVPPAAPQQPQHQQVQQQPDFSIDTPLVTIPPRQGQTEQAVPLRYSGDRPAELPVVQDAETSTGPVKVSFTVGDWMRFDTGAGWLMRVKVDGADKIVAPQSRILMIRLGDKLYRKTYKLQPADVGAVNLTLAPPVPEARWSAWSWLGRRGAAPLVPLHVTTGSTAAHNLRVVTAGAQDKDSKALMAGPFTLCSDVDCQTAAQDISGGGPTQLWLKPSGPAPQSGIYEGTFTLVADGVASPPSFNLKFEVTSPWAKLGGTILLIAGTLLGLLLAYGLNARVQMLNAGRPAALVLKRVRSVQSKLKDLHAKHQAFNWPNLDDALRTVAEKVDAKAMADFGIGSGWRALFRLVSEPLDTAGLAAYVGAQAKAEAALEVLATRGIAVAASEVPPPATIGQMITDLDALALRPDLADGEQMLAAIGPILARTSPNGQTLLTGARVQASAKPIPWTVDWIDIEAARAGSAWLTITALLTVLVGWSVLVANNPGFGHSQDYVLCLLWGLGLTTGAGALPALDAGKIRTQIAFPRPG